MAFPGNELLAAFDGGIKTIICKHSPGKPQPENRSPGIHQHREILFVLKGQSEFPLNHKLFTVKAGDVVLVDRWIAH
ncbi:MAG: cupin domain-containing protein, partial [Lentisphaeria bacterium]|nr:cupin domain-containing protein [Lentisphaeria bacterium]